MDIPSKTRPRLFLVDAYALIYRAFFAFINRPLTNSRGENTSAAFGFANFLEDLRETFEPDYLAVVFDAGDSFREQEYPEYKATREKMPEDLSASLPGIRAMVEAYGDPVVELDGYEADDVIGTLATQAKAHGIESVIVSGDKDFYQLVDEDVHLMNPGRGGPGDILEVKWPRSCSPPQQRKNFLKPSKTPQDMMRRCPSGVRRSSSAGKSSPKFQTIFLRSARRSRRDLRDPSAAQCGDPYGKTGN